MNPLRRYAHWLHGRWPAGRVEKLPVVRDDGSTSVPGVYVVGDLGGIPLLKFSLDAGARVARAIAADAALRDERRDGASGVIDVVIVGAGAAGMAAACELRRAGVDFRVLEASEPFSTIVNFPKAKPIYTYPRDFEPAGELQVHADVKESLLVELREQTAGIEVSPARAERVRRKGRILEVVVDGGENVRARRVILAQGRSGNHRRLGVPGESSDKVSNRLHDPEDFAGRRVLVVGGGDSALEAALALDEAGADVTLSFRGESFARPKPGNVERLEASRGIRIVMGSTVRSIGPESVVLDTKGGGAKDLPNDVVFVMIGRDAPLEFFRRSALPIRGEWTWRFWVSAALVVAAFAFLYTWKAGGALTAAFAAHGWFPFGIDPTGSKGLGRAVRISFGTPGAWYTLAYTVAIVSFGILRIRRRRTPYVTAQTLTLMAVQTLPLFLLPYVLLPWLGNAGAFGTRYAVERVSRSDAAAWLTLEAEHPDDPVALLAGAREAGALPAAVAAWPDLTAEVSWKQRVDGDRVLLRSAASGAPTREAVLRLSDLRVHVRDDARPSSRVADALFPASEWDPQGREYWRSIGFVLAWPLFLWNVFTYQPMGWWLAISLMQTFVLIPWIVLRWGKGAYCGWICSCGALAETMGDAHREKMPHGPAWNRLNLTGQVVLGVASVLLLLRAAGWFLPGGHPVNAAYAAILAGHAASGAGLPFPFPFLNYKWMVDLLFAGILGTGLYFHFSGRVWCRFACPLAALMHVYARFSRFRILADKKKCISCNVCTTVCHQGIDVMAFANRGAPMEDPQCVRCSACVQSCPTGVLTFGAIDRGTGRVIRTDRLVASAVAQREAVAAAPAAEGAAA